jgi:predicted  nucleic acid-binding Zn-ribbon protein
MAVGEPVLTTLESVRCLECGAAYSKPADGGTVRENPGCPECGYVGWVRLTTTDEERPTRRSGAGRQPGPRR